MISIGFGYVFHCPLCGEATYLALGIGREYTPESVFYGSLANPPLIMDFTAEEIYRKALTRLNHDGIPDTELPGSYGHKLYYCPECRTLKVHFYFAITNEGKVWHPKYRCELCKTVLTLSPGQEHGDDPEKFRLTGKDGEILRIRCDKCGKVYFAPESGCTSKIHWD